MGISNTSIGTIPAIYAQACQGGNGKRYIVLTNKGSNAVPVQITQDETNLTNVFLETYVTGSDPSVTNAAPPNSAVLIQTATVTNPITIPQYSVVRLEWTVFNVPAPVLSLTVTNSVPTLQWTGLTNVVYNVQGSANLALTWATLGKIYSAETNFSFSDPDGDPFRFYRLLVP